MQYWVYILCSNKKGTLYIGVTNDIKRRIFEHKNKGTKGFTKKYGVDKLVYAEEFQNISDALLVEKSMKKWLRRWKIELIEKKNPNWNDLSESL